MLCLSSGSAFAHSACWKMTGQFYSPQTDVAPTYTCWNGTAQSSAKAIATGHASSGYGLAWDYDIACEAEVRTAAATGIYTVAYKNGCDGPGDIEFFGQAAITGTANLVDDDCAGAALGYQQIKSNVLDAPIDAVLDQSAGETRSGTLGDITAAHKGIEVSVPITYGLGEGQYTDNDQDARFAYKCDNFFEYEKKSRAYIKVWANSGFWDLVAKVECTMSGSASVQAVLGTCPHSH
jgi:hypothetical protein